MSLELSMVGLVVRGMAVSLEFYRRLGVEIPADADSERFVMHRIPGDGGGGTGWKPPEPIWSLAFRPLQG